MNDFVSWIENKYANVMDNQISAKNIQLTVEQEKKLFEQVHAGNSLAKGLLVLIYERYIDAILRENCALMNSRIERQEYLDQGIDIILKCIDNFDVNNGVRFSTYVYKSLKNIIEKVNTRNNMHVRSINQYTISLYEPITTNKKKDDKELTYADCLSSEEYDKESESIEQASLVLYKFLEFLPDRKRDILIKHSGLEGFDEMDYLDISQSPEYKGVIKHKQVASLGKTALTELQDLYKNITNIKKQLLLGKNRKELALSNKMSLEDIDYYVNAYNYIFNAIGTKPERVTVETSNHNKNTKNKKIKKENTRTM